MKTIVCPISIVPLRKNADHRSEQLSQMLFGESAGIIDTREDWLQVKLNFDGYSGWIEKDSVVEAYSEFLSAKKVIISEPYVTISNKNQEMKIPAGSELPAPDTEGCFQLGELQWCIDNYNELPGINENSIAETARKFLNAPYLWGGRTLFGIDCSGFTQLVYKIHGRKLPRDAKDQVRIGKQVMTLAEAQSGDLIFFNNKEGAIVHTGILLDNSRIIHASKWVRIDTLDEKGIYNIERKKYTHQLNSIKRYQ